MKTLLHLLAFSLFTLPQAFAQTNTVYGSGAGKGGTYNTHIGTIAGKVSTASYNTFLGYGGGYRNTSGSENTFLGYRSGYYNTTGRYNSFVGTFSGYNNTNGYSNTFLGYSSGRSNTAGEGNTFLGSYSGKNNATGYWNTFLGSFSGENNYTGRYNTYLGFAAGNNNQSGYSNVFIGFRAGYSETGSNLLYIDNNSDNNPLLYGNFSSNVLSIGKKYTGTAYKLDIPGKVRATAYDVVSDERLKKDVQGLQDVLAKVQKVEGVSYALKEDTAAVQDQSNSKQANTRTGKARNPVYYGFLAQNIQQIFPELVTEDEGMLAVNYQGMIPVLVEAIKELSLQKDSHHQLQAQLDQLTLENAALKEEITSIKEALGLSNPSSPKGADIPADSLLEQNRPNPFDQATTIGYQAPAQAQQVSLLITNLQGSVVLRLDNLALGAGQVEVAAGSLPAGTYVYTLVVDGRPLASQKMMLTR